MGGESASLPHKNPLSPLTTDRPVDHSEFKAASENNPREDEGYEADNENNTRKNEGYEADNENVSSNKPYRSNSTKEEVGSSNRKKTDNDNNDGGNNSSGGGDLGNSHGPSGGGIQEVPAALQVIQVGVV